MRLLSLVRHAKSSWEIPGQGDFERPLNARGQRDAPVMARRVLEEGVTPGRLVSSPANRAITTAGIFAGAFGVPSAQIRIEPAIYDASLGTLIQVVRELDDDAAAVMMFGHNPGLSELANMLAPCGFDEMPTCAVAELLLSVDRWREVTPGCGRLLRYLYPKDRGG